MPSPYSSPALKIANIFDTYFHHWETLKMEHYAYAQMDGPVQIDTSASFDATSGNQFGV